MTVTMPYIPPNVYLLADNLDAALAAGEDLLKTVIVWNAGDGQDGVALGEVLAAQRAALESVRTLEQLLVARVLKSRERAEEIAKRDPRFASVARLYNSGTAPLMEAVTDFADPVSQGFQTGGGGVAFLRSRGLLAEDDAGPADGRTVPISEDFLVAHRVRLGSVLDLVAMFLDALETHYELFSDDLRDPDSRTDDERPSPGGSLRV